MRAVRISVMLGRPMLRAWLSLWRRIMPMRSSIVRGSARSCERRILPVNPLTREVDSAASGRRLTFEWSPIPTRRGAPRRRPGHRAGAVSA